METSSVRTAFFELLRAGLRADRGYSVRMQPLTASEWSAVLGIAEKQTVLGLLFDGLENAPKESRPPRDLFLRGYACVARIEQTNERLNARLAELLAFFETESLHPVVLKGSGLAANYPRPLHRQCGDIDLYAGPGYERANVLLDRIAALEKPDEKHTTYLFDGIPVENHRLTAWFHSPYRNRIYRALESEWLGENRSSVTLSGRTVPVPPPTFDALYVLIHAFLHLLGTGIGLRQLCDWTLLVHRKNGEIDRERLGEMLDALRIRRAAKAFGHVAVHYLGLPEEEVPFPINGAGRDGELLLREILRDGNFGHYEDMARKNKTPFRERMRRLSRYMSRTPRLYGLSEGESGWRLWARITHRLHG